MSSAQGNRGGAEARFEVVVNTRFEERERLLENILYWATAMARPRLGSSARFGLRYVFSGERHDGCERLEAVILDLLHDTGLMRDFPGGVWFSYCALRPDEDLYRNTAWAGEPPRKGFKSGPNTQIFKILEGFCAEKEAVLVMEADCYPIREGWLDAVAAEMFLPEYFVCGSVYMGKSKLVAWAMQHINGNAIYATGREGFRDFVSGWWRPHVESHAEFVDPFIAYDVLPQKFFSLAGPAECREAFREDFRKYGNRFLRTTLILNYGGGKDVAENSPAMEQLRERHPRCHLVHGRYLRAAVLDRLGPGVMEARRRLKDIDAGWNGNACLSKPSQTNPKEPVWVCTHLSNYSCLRSGTLEFEAGSNSWAAFIYRLPSSGPKRFWLDFSYFGSLPKVRIEARLAGGSRLARILRQRDEMVFDTLETRLKAGIKAVESHLWRFARNWLPRLFLEDKEGGPAPLMLRFYRRFRSQAAAFFGNPPRIETIRPPASQNETPPPGVVAGSGGMTGPMERIRTKSFPITAKGRARSTVAVFVSCRDSRSVIHLAARPRLRLR